MVAGLVMVAISAVVVLVLTDPAGVAPVSDTPGLRYGLLGVSVAFLLYVFDQERRLRRLAAVLVRERVLSAALEARVRDLVTLSRVGQVVNSVLGMEQVLQIVVESSFELTRAATGSVMLVEDDELVVAASAGAEAAPTGSRQPVTAGVAGWVASRHQPLLITGRLAEEQLPALRERRRGASSSVCAPMLVGGELLGVLALERPPEAPSFTEADLRSVALFASHAATAVAHARRYDRENSQAERLAELLEHRAEFVASTVHDLKTPLTGIVGFARLLRRHPERLPGELRSRAVDAIEQSAEEMVRLVDHVLDGTRTEITTEVRREPVDLAALLENLVRVTASMAEARDGVERPIRLTAPGGGPVFHGDPRALRSVFANLLENAVKYSPPGSPVEVALVRNGTEVQVVISDRGEGIPEEELDGIFERFRRRGEGGAEGMGLGLYIVRSLVVAQRGRIRVESEVGAGSSFHVTLPLDGVGPAGADAGAGSEARAGPR